VVEAAALPEGTVRLLPGKALSFVAEAFRAAGVPSDQAALIAEVLASADLRGIRSHGLSRMSYFMVRLERNTMKADPQLQLSRGSSTTAVLDGDNGIGIVVADRAMDEAMRMAGEHGAGFVAVKNSSHFGYAGYWAERAMRNGFIGISMSNSGRRVTPTFGAQSLLGTNPLSVTMPGGEAATDFYLDMATSAVAVGKVETALNEGRTVQPGWVAEAGEPPDLDEYGILTYDAPLLPLGGEGDQTGGHKGYGLSLMVELLCGALSGTGLTERIEGASGHAPAAMGHFMGAIDISGFRDLDLVQADMEETFEVIRGATKAPGHDRIFIHGEPETIAAQTNRSLGIPVTPGTMVQLQRWNTRFDLGFELP
jgi:L-2-hydroxycarboxylate dehydrogenase (NAD+)